MRAEDLGAANGKSNHWLLRRVCARRPAASAILPLLDRLEILELPGYTEAEKLEIARHYLVTTIEEAMTYAFGDAAPASTDEVRARDHVGTPDAAGMAAP